MLKKIVSCRSEETRPIVSGTSNFNTEKILADIASTITSLEGVMSESVDSSNVLREIISLGRGFLENPSAEFGQIQREFDQLDVPECASLLSPLVELLMIQINNYEIAQGYAVDHIAIDRTKFQLELFEPLLMQALARVERIAGKEIVMVVGNTDSGKSTSLNDFFGCNVVREQSLGFRSKFVSTPELFEIGHKSEAQTLYPQALTEPVSGLTYCDCPGFDDDRGLTFDFVASLGTYLTTKVAQVKALAVVVPITAFEDQNAKNFIDLASTLDRFLGDNIKDCKDSVFFLFTKLPKDTTKEDILDALERIMAGIPSGKDASPKDIALSNFLMFMYQHQDNFLLVDPLDAGETRNLITDKLKAARGIQSEQFNFVSETRAEVAFRTIITNVLQKAEAIDDFEATTHQIEAAEERESQLTQALQEIQDSLKTAQDGVIGKEQQLTGLSRSKEAAESQLAAQRTEVCTFRTGLEEKINRLELLDTSDLVVHKTLKFEPTTGFWNLKIHQHTFNYADNPFVEVQEIPAGEMYLGIANVGRAVGPFLFKTVVEYIPAGIIAGKSVPKQILAMGLALEAGTKAAIETYKKPPYDEFLSKKEDREKGTYSGTYKTLYAGVRPKADVLIVGEKRLRADYKQAITVLRGQIATLEAQIAKKEGPIKELGERCQNLQQQIQEAETLGSKQQVEELAHQNQLLIQDLGREKEALTILKAKRGRLQPEIDGFCAQFHSLMFIFEKLDLSEILSIDPTLIQHVLDLYTQLQQR
ncbi:hypothetical protein HOC37_07970 [bacterium]|jgi:hypothetical protein|nr:hypothetical protein [bacterium]